MALVLDTPPKLMLTPAEWDALPDTSGLELVDGMVHFMPSATMGHEHVKAELRNRLHQVRPPGIRITTEMEIQLSGGHRRKPDVVAVHADPTDFSVSTVMLTKVILAVEVVSPGSETIDRKHKPAEYADAGLPHYWRLELQPQIEAHTYRLGDTGWVETGVWTAGDTIAAPGLMWAKIPMDDLVEGF